MSTIEKAITQIQTNALSQTKGGYIEPRIQCLVVLAYIVVTLSLPLDDPASLLWLFCFPIIMSEASGFGYGRLFIRSIWILPLLLIIGIFNPIYDRTEVMHIGTIAINHGWMTYISLVLRGLLAYQGLLLLVSNYGFYDLCRCLQFFRCPKVLVTQLLMLYRYIGVLLSESLNMHRARQARGYGREHYPLRMWGVFIGQLFIRSVNRAHRVNDAMMARGFTGTFIFAPFDRNPQIKDYIYLVIWCAVFAVIRFVNLTTIMAQLIMK